MLARTDMVEASSSRTMGRGRKAMGRWGRGREENDKKQPRRTESAHRGTAVNQFATNHAQATVDQGSAPVSVLQPVDRVARNVPGLAYPSVH